MSFADIRNGNDDVRLFRITGVPSLPPLPLISKIASDLNRRATVVGCVDNDDVEQALYDRDANTPGNQADCAFYVPIKPHRQETRFMSQAGP